jgi:ubiquinone/menaquinone biosynthesis C-methylase UbiE
LWETGNVSHGRDVAVFDERAQQYDCGWLGRLHHEIVDRTVTVALSSQPDPRRILDVGCGTGHLLRTIASRCPNAVELAGIDPAAAMVDAARAQPVDPRISVDTGFAERIPYPDDRFDLVLSTTSFDHWANQREGVAECARVLGRRGCLIIADLFSPFLLPTLIGSRRDKARTKPRAARMLTRAGVHVVGWHDVSPLIKAVVAVA